LHRRLDWVWSIEDEAWGNVIVGIQFVLDFSKGAEFEAGDVGQDGSTAGGDAIFDHQASEGAEEVVDLGGGLKVQRVRAEVTREVHVGCGAEAGVDVMDAE
jgi:hypothetical protein